MIIVVHSYRISWQKANRILFHNIKTGWFSNIFQWNFIHEILHKTQISKTGINGIALAEFRVKIPRNARGSSEQSGSSEPTLKTLDILILTWCELGEKVWKLNYKYLDSYTSFSLAFMMHIHKIICKGKGRMVYELLCLIKRKTFYRLSRVILT